MIKIAVFADIHGNFEALKAIYKDIEAEKITEVYSLGDMIAIGSEPKETIDFIRSKNIVALKGNHEDYYTSIVSQGTVDIPQQELNHQMWVSKTLGEDYFDYFDELPYEITLNYEGIHIYMCHYPFKRVDGRFKSFLSLDSTINQLSFEGINADLYIFGHQHSGKQTVLDKKIRLVNLKSSGVTSTDTTTYTIIIINDHSYEIITKEIRYDRASMIKKFETYKVPEGAFIKKFFYKIEE